MDRRPPRPVGPGCRPPDPVGLPTGPNPGNLVGRHRPSTGRRPRPGTHAGRGSRRAIPLRRCRRFGRADRRPTRPNYRGPPGVLRCVRRRPPPGRMVRPPRGPCRRPRPPGRRRLLAGRPVPTDSGRPANRCRAGRRGADQRTGGLRSRHLAPRSRGGYHPPPDWFGHRGVTGPAPRCSGAGDSRVGVRRPVHPASHR